MKDQIFMRPHLSSKISGFKHYQGALAFPKMSIGSQLKLILDEGNPHDDDAVAIYFEEYKLGYVSRFGNADIAYLLRHDCEAINCHVQALHPHKETYEQVEIVFFWQEEIFDQAIDILNQRNLKKIRERYIMIALEEKNGEEFYTVKVKLIYWKSHVPYGEWIDYCQIPVDSSSEQRNEAIEKALQDTKYFPHCSNCHEINNQGHMTGEICQSCFVAQGGVF